MISSTAVDHAGTELVRVDAGGAVDVTGEHVLPAREALGLELLDRDVLGRLPVVLGDPVGDGHLDRLPLGDRLGRLDRPPQRAGEDGVDALEGEVLGEVPRLVLAHLRQLRVRRTLEALDP